jgi:hypothetical protein
MGVQLELSGILTLFGAGSFPKDSFSAGLSGTGSIPEPEAGPDRPKEKM